MYLYLVAETGENQKNPDVANALFMHWKQRGLVCVLGWGGGRCGGRGGLAVLRGFMQLVRGVSNLL